MFILWMIFIGYHIWSSYTQNGLRNMAIQTLESFKRNNVNYWVDYGTLLGIVREGDIIYGDYDIDFMVRKSPDLHEKMLKVAADLGNKYHLEYHPWGAYRIVKRNFIKLIYADVYLVDEKDGMYVEVSGKIPCSLVGNCKTIQWKGVDVRVPEHIEDSLIWRYGKTWKTPKKFGKAVNR